MGEWLLVRQPHDQNHEFAAKEIRKTDSRGVVEGRIGMGVEEDTKNKANKERGKRKKEKVE